MTVEQESLLAWIKASLKIPETVSFEITNQRLVLQGNASYQWVNSLDVAKLDSPWINSIDSRHVTVNELQELQALRTSISNTRIYFSNGTETVVGVEKILMRLTKNMKRISALADALDYAIVINLLGHTDGLGNRRKNEALALKRADWVFNRLQENGVLSSLLQPLASEIELNNQLSIVYRRVEFKMDIKK